MKLEEGLILPKLVKNNLGGLVNNFEF